MSYCKFHASSHKHTTIDFSFIIPLTNRDFHNCGCTHEIILSPTVCVPFLASYPQENQQKRARAHPRLTLQPNMSDSVRLLHISLHWHITGEKHLRFLRGGDITSTPIDTKHTEHRPPALRSARGHRAAVMRTASASEERAVFKQPNKPRTLSSPVLLTRRGR